MRGGSVAVLGCLLLGCAAAKGSAVSNDVGHGSAETFTRASLQLDGADLGLHLPVERSPPLPAVLMFHSALGPTEAVRGYADSLAERGYAVCVLDFYGGELPANLEQAMALRDAANQHLDVHQARIANAYAMLAVDPRVRATRRFLLGWSYGGAWATFSAGALDDVSGVVAIYGEAFADPTLYDRISAPVLLVGASRDTEPSVDRLRDVEADLRGRGNEVSVVVLDADHGFMEPAHPAYAEAAAQQAWRSVLGFLDGAPAREPSGHAAPRRAHEP